MDNDSFACGYKENIKAGTAQCRTLKALWREGCMGVKMVLLAPGGALLLF
jgi:hypothetical protein